MKINKQIIRGGKQQFADTIVNGADTHLPIKKGIDIDKEKIKSLISKGNLITATNLLLKQNVNLEIEKELLLIKSKISILTKNKNLELANYENNSIMESKITLALLEVLQKK